MITSNQYQQQMAQAPNSQYTQPGMAATYQLMAAPGQNFPIMLQPSLVKKKKNSFVLKEINIIIKILFILI